MNGALALLAGLTTGFALAKLVGWITWSWLWVFSPLWAPAVFAILSVLIVVAGLAGLAGIFEASIEEALKELMDE